MSEVEREAQDSPGCVQSLYTSAPATCSPSFQERGMKERLQADFEQGGMNNRKTRCPAGPPITCGRDGRCSSKIPAPLPGQNDCWGGAARPGTMMFPKPSLHLGGAIAWFWPTGCGHK